MLWKLIKNKKAQNTAEYAILISLVVAGIIAMQTYAQRALQGRVRGASQYLVNQTTEFGDQVQYEPYYLNKSYNVTQGSTISEIQDNETLRYEEDSDTVRQEGGSETTTWDSTASSAW